MKGAALLLIALLATAGIFVSTGIVRADETTTTDQATSDQMTPAAAPATQADSVRAPLGHKLNMSETETRAYGIVLWASLLTGDMKETYKTYGYPPSRYRESVMGRVSETWVYDAKGKKFTFEDGKLIQTVEFSPGSGLMYETFGGQVITSP